MHPPTALSSLITLPFYEVLNRHSAAPFRNELLVFVLDEESTVQSVHELFAPGPERSSFRVLSEITDIGARRRPRKVVVLHRIPTSVPTAQQASVVCMLAHLCQHRHIQLVDYMFIGPFRGVNSMKLKGLLYGP